MSGGPQRSIKCIICSQIFTGKGFRGSYKRHLQNAHITRQAHQCKTCRAMFSPETPKAAIKKHCKDCGLENRGSKTMLLEPNIFGCEFTGACFVAKDSFVDHLLALSNNYNMERPTPCYIRKLHGLLEHATYHRHVESLSLAMLGDAEGWRNLEWDQNTAAETSKQLEYFDVTTYCNPCPGTTSNIQTFLQHVVFKSEQIPIRHSQLVQQYSAPPSRQSNSLIHPPMSLVPLAMPLSPTSGINALHTLNGSSTSLATYHLSPPQDVASQWTSSRLNDGRSLSEQLEPPLPSSLQQPSYNWSLERSGEIRTVNTVRDDGVYSQQRKRRSAGATPADTEGGIHQDWQTVLPFQGLDTDQESFDQEVVLGEGVGDMYFNHPG